MYKIKKYNMHWLMRMNGRKNWLIINAWYYSQYSISRWVICTLTLFKTTAITIIRNVSQFILSSRKFK